MAQLFNIQDDKVVINKLALRYLEGSIIHAGSLDIIGNASIQNNLNIKGELTVETLNVKNIVTDQSSSEQLGKWIVSEEEQLQGQGFTWSWGTGTLQLSYREGKRLWTNGDIDLSAEGVYRINNIPVLSLTELLPQITKSKLKEVGSLKALTVTGNANIGDVAFINSVTNRVGINTDQPNGSFSIVDNDGEFIVDSPNYGTFNIGSYTNHDVSFISDNVPRFTVKKNGEIVFGSSATKTALVTIYGTLKVDNIVSDTRIDRYSPLEFKTTRDQSFYGLGLYWDTGNGSKKLVMKSGPDRLWSSDSIDVAAEKGYYINNSIVLSSHALGEYVTQSNLKTVGVLESLSVQGDCEFEGNLSGQTGAFESLTISNVYIANHKINAENNISINVSEDEILYSDEHEIAIGNKLNARRPVKVFGPVSIGINNADPTVALDVGGNVKFNNKKFITGSTIPETGSFLVGDICWNEKPTIDGYVGWICILEGAPGKWAPFGAISRV